MTPILQTSLGTLWKLASAHVLIISKAQTVETIGAKISSTAYVALKGYVPHAPHRTCRERCSEHGPTSEGDLSDFAGRAREEHLRSEIVAYDLGSHRASGRGHASP
jgi:hypothetical protein